MSFSLYVRWVEYTTTVYEPPAFSRLVFNQVFIHMLTDGKRAEEVDEVLPLRPVTIRKVICEPRRDKREVVWLRVAVLERLGHLVEHALLQDMELHVLLVRIQRVRVPCSLRRSSLRLRHALAVRDTVNRALLELHDVLRERACLVREDVLDLAQVIRDIPRLRRAGSIKRLVVHVHVLRDEEGLNRLDDFNGDVQ